MLIISETKERTPEEEAYLQNECRLIFGVTQLAKEGLVATFLPAFISSIAFPKFIAVPPNRLLHLSY